MFNPFSPLNPNPFRVPPAEDARAAAVRTAAQLLDDIRPGWDRDVNPDDLDMGSSTRCVLGQAFGREAGKHAMAGYNYGIRLLGHGLRDVLTSGDTCGLFSASVFAPYWVAELKARQRRQQTQAWQLAPVAEEMLVPA